MRYLPLLKCIECDSTELDGDSRVALCQPCFDQLNPKCEFCEEPTYFEELIDNKCPDCYKLQNCESCGQPVKCPCGNKLSTEQDKVSGVCANCR